MSNYCTNCKWLERRKTANESYWKCCVPNAIVPRLNSLCGNPLKSPFCINGNWYKAKVKQQEKKMTTEEMIKVMQAYEDGKQIQEKFSGEMDKTWRDCVNLISWNWYHFDYRIKPEPKQIIIKESEFEEIISIAKTLIARLENNKKE